FCKGLQLELVAGMKRWIFDSIQGMVSLPLLRGRLEPQETGTPRRIALCRRHYLSGVVAANHRLALTRLLCGSFYFRGLRTNLLDHPPSSLLCRRCGEGLETPGHVFMQCRDALTVAERESLRESLLRSGFTLRTPSTEVGATQLMKDLIFNWDTVAEIARFVCKVARGWRWFGRRLPTLVSEFAPNTDDEGEDEELETGTEDGSDDGFGTRGNRNGDGLLIN
ncbi:hypothetical protein R3P38DRAFT_2529862, partial [Favolaschia claudopus]